MMLYARSCERPSKSSASVFLPSSVSNSYSFSTGTHGSCRRCSVTFFVSSACSASSLASSSRAACHSSRVPTVCSVMVPPVDVSRAKTLCVSASHRWLDDASFPRGGQLVLDSHERDRHAVRRRIRRRGCPPSCPGGLVSRSSWPSGRKGGHERRDRPANRLGVGGEAARAAMSDEVPTAPVRR